MKGTKNARLLALLLAAMLVITAVLSGCGSSQGTQTPKPQAEETENASAETEETDAEVKEEAAASEEEAAAEEETEEETEPVELVLDDSDPASTQFTYLLATGVDSVFYEEYEDGPVAKWWMDQLWDSDGDGTAKKISIDFITPPAGSEKENANTLLATGEYPDIMAMSNSSQSATQLFEEGIAMDITDLVKEYMPNYLYWVDQHNFYNYVTNDVNGERRFIQLYDITDQVDLMWGGHVYRRDWIVRYGTNPETGEAFSGSWNEDHTVWTDDVVFPSGNTDPIYISDWEWMIEIFDRALKEQNVEDGYALSIPYYGISPMGDFVSGFGAGGEWCLNEDGVCVFGPTQDGYRAALECLNNWYAKGWIDPSFDERTNDQFFNVNTPAVYAGKVGMWYGLNSQVGDALDASGGNPDDLTYGMVLFGAAQPINDVYGDASCQGHEPFQFYCGNISTQSVIITDHASEKDLATLLTAWDYLYSFEGGMIRNQGFSDKMQAEIQDPFYLQYDLTEGGWKEVEGDDGETWYLVDAKARAVDGLSAAISLSRVIGLLPHKNIDKGYSPTNRHSIEQWTMYPAYGNISVPVTNQYTAEQTEELSLITNNTRTYLFQETPKFITGGADPSNDADWQAFVDGLIALDVNKNCEYTNDVLSGN